MRTTVLLLLACLCIACSEKPSKNDTTIAINAASGQTEPQSFAATDETDPIATIKANYSQIRQQLEGGSLRKDEQEFQCEDDPGFGTLTRYYDGDRLVMVSHAEGADHFYVERQVYFSDGEPFFVYEQEGSWSFGGPGDGENPTTIDTNRERRYYLKSGEVIRELYKEWEDKSWETKKDPAQVPNQTKEVKKGATYPMQNEVGAWIAGEVGC